MRKYFFSVCTLLVALSASAQIKYDVTLKGIPGRNDKMVYLVSRETQEVLDSIMPDEEGIAKFSGEVEAPCVAAIASTPALNYSLCNFILDGKTTVLNYQDVGLTELLKGSKENRTYFNGLKDLHEATRNAHKAYSDFAQMRVKYGNDVPEEEIEKLRMQLKEVVEDSKAALLKTLEENRNNTASLATLLSYTTEFEPAFLMEYLKDYPFAGNAGLKPIFEMLEQEARKMPGAQVTDLVMNDLQDNEVHLTDWVGKGSYVLVDFWASWCGPCRAEMPNVKAAYEKYHDKGFEIVGISFDNKKEAWEKGVAELGITWPQMSDLKGWNCAASDIYNIKSIPATILFDPNGQVITTNLRGKQLEDKLKELIK